MGRSAVRTCRVFARAITALTLAGGATGCSPLVAMEPASPDGPRISRLQLTPERSTVGCPVELRFSFDAPREELVKAIAGWTLTYGRRGALGYLTLATDPPQTVQVDGELFGNTPITAKVIPQAVRVIVP